MKDFCFASPHLRQTKKTFKTNQEETGERTDLQQLAAAESPDDPGGWHFLNGDVSVAVELPTCETMVRCIAGARVTLSDLSGHRATICSKVKQSESIFQRWLLNI